VLLCSVLPESSRALEGLGTEERTGVALVQRIVALSSLLDSCAKENCLIIAFSRLSHILIAVSVLLFQQITAPAASSTHHGARN